MVWVVPVFTYSTMLVGCTAPKLMLLFTICSAEPAPTANGQ
jgi:hypothetical protein